VDPQRKKGSHEKKKIKGGTRGKLKLAAFFKLKNTLSQIRKEVGRSASRARLEVVVGKVHQKGKERRRRTRVFGISLLTKAQRRLIAKHKKEEDCIMSGEAQLTSAQRSKEQKVFAQ